MWEQQRPHQGMSEEETRNFLLSLDPQLIEAAIKQKKETTTDIRRPSIGHENIYQSTVPSMRGLPKQLSTYEDDGTTNIQPQINAALSVAENLLHHPTSVRKVSVKPGEVTKSGIFARKKSTDPTLVFTFNGNDNQDEFPQSPGQSSPLPMKNSYPTAGENEGHHGPSHHSLAVHQLHDKVETGSVASFRSAGMATHVSSTQEIIEKKMEKKQRFFDFFTMVISLCYGILVVIFSICMYASDLVLTNAYEKNHTEAWNLFLSSVGIILLLWLIFDIQTYIWKINKMSKGSSFMEGLKLVEGPDGELHIEVPMKDKGKKKNVPEYYGFAMGRHSGSFFLKIGAALFCFGHLIHMGLNMVKHIYAMTGDDVKVEKYCGQKEGLAYDIIYPVFSLIQLYFVFKYGNVIVNKNKWLARITFIHCLSSSLSFWINTLINETLDAIVTKFFVKKVNNCYEYDYNYTTTTTTTIATTTDDDDFFNQPITGLADLPPCDMGGSGITNNVICVIETRASCNTGPNAADIFAVATWLYPFTIEFSILVVAIWYILWSSIGKIQEHKDSLEFLPSITPQGSTENLHRTEGHKQNLILFADCTSSNMGLFFGVVLIVVVIVGSLIVIVNEGNCDPSLALHLGNGLKIGVLSLLIIASIIAYFIIAQFDVNPEPISFLDDMLLLMCLPSFFLYSLVALGPSIYLEFESELFVVNLLTLIQVLIQTPMIVDGLRRCSNSVEDQRKMKGRNLITFLIVANLAVYVMETLLIKSYDYQTAKIDFYGPEAWTILSHMTLPICIFYRFHSAVALVDIWKSAYKAPEHH